MKKEQMACLIFRISLLLVWASEVAAVETTRFEIDMDAFSELPGADRLEPGAQETGDEVVSLPVGLPIIGLGALGNIETLGQESEEPEASFIFSEPGDWYSQFEELEAGEVYIDGQRSAMTDEQLRTEAEIASFENPSVLFLGHGADGLTPNEVSASFAIGGGFYRVTLVCRPERIEMCSDEKEILRIVRQLEVLGDGADS